MSTTAPEAPTRKSAAGSSAAWRLSDRIGLGFAWFVGLLFCAICAAIVIFMAVKGLQFLHVSDLWTNATATNGGGFLTPEENTAIVVGIAMLIAVPVGVAIAVWLSEYNRPRVLARVVESTVEMLAGIPSIVLALFGVLLFELHDLSFLSQTTPTGAVYGLSFFAAGPILGVLGLPYVVTPVREGLQAIPNHVREASYALGKSKAATIRRVLLPANRPSIITGSMLSAGHVIGDTAIILFLLGDTLTRYPVGHTPVLSLLRGTGDSMTSVIFDNAPTGDLNNPPKAYAMAFVLLLVVLALNVVVDVFGRRTKELRWS